jgi:mono/diheme cytochrome c family protein
MKNKALVLVLLLVGLYAAFGLVWVLGRGLSTPTPDEDFPRAEYPAEDLVFDPTNIPVVEGKVTPPVDLAAVLQPSSETLASGDILFSQTCASCHGPSGRGDGPAGTGLDPAPRNFHEPLGWKVGHRVTDIYRTLTFGIPGSSMTAYDYLAPDDRFSLAHYVRSLGDFPLDQDTEESIARLDQELGLSQGIREPSRAPVPLVLERMAQERSPVAVMTLPASWGGTIREEVMRSAVADLHRAAGVLSRAGEEWRQDTDTMVRLATAGVPGNGFATTITTLSPGEWDILREAFAELLPINGTT